MPIPRDLILTFIERRAGAEQAAQAAEQLPAVVDADRDADLLARLGVDPQELAAHVGLAGGVGGSAAHQADLADGSSADEHGT